MTASIVSPLIANTLCALLYLALHLPGAVAAGGHVAELGRGRSGSLLPAPTTRWPAPTAGPTTFCGRGSSYPADAPEDGPG